MAFRKNYRKTKKRGGAKATGEDEADDTIHLYDLLPIDQSYTNEQYIDLYKKFFKEDPILNNNNTISQDDKRRVYNEILKRFATDFYKLAMNNILKGSVGLDYRKIKKIFFYMRGEDNTTKNEINKIFTKRHEVTKLHKEKKIDTTEFTNKAKEISIMVDKLYKQIFPEEEAANALEDALLNVNSNKITYSQLNSLIENAKKYKVNKKLIHRAEVAAEKLKAAAENAKKRFGTNEMKEYNRVVEAEKRFNTKSIEEDDSSKGGRKKTRRRRKKKANQTHHKKRRRNSRKKHNTRRKR
jgi:hypothetical protein